MAATSDFILTPPSSQCNPDSIIPKGRRFKMASLNITSLLKHLDELRVLLNYNCIDLLAINDTRLDGSISDQDIKVEGYYDVIHCDRTVNGRFGGGVCFYIRLDINYVVRKDLDDQLLEILSIEIRKPNSKPFVVTSWYRPPNSSPDLFPHLDTVLGRLDSEHVEHYLIVDMNCNLLSSDNIHTRALLSITEMYGLKQLIDEPTRITPSSSTLIDLIFTSHQDNIICSGVSHVGISDHSLVYAWCKISIPVCSKGINLIYYRQFKHFNSTNFRNDILTQSCDDIKEF